MHSLGIVRGREFAARIKCTEKCVKQLPFTVKYLSIIRSTWKCFFTTKASFQKAHITEYFISPITDAPVCGHEKVVLIGASKNENMEILCEIYADPPAR